MAAGGGCSRFRRRAPQSGSGGAAGLGPVPAAPSAGGPAAFPEPRPLVARLWDVPVIPPPPPSLPKAVLK